jgi:hypothetical protein
LLDESFNLRSAVIFVPTFVIFEAENILECLIANFARQFLGTSMSFCVSF